MNELERRFIAARRKAIELDYQRLNPMQREGVLTTGTASGAWRS